MYLPAAAERSYRLLHTEPELDDSASVEPVEITEDEEGLFEFAFDETRQTENVELDLNLQNLEFDWNAHSYSPDVLTQNKILHRNTTKK